MILGAVLALGAGYAVGAKSYQNAMLQVDEELQTWQRTRPESNRYEPASATNFIAYAQPKRVFPDVDLRGVPHYWVDYGSGALTKQYTTPEFYRGQFSQFHN